MFDGNVRSAWLAARAVLPGMRAAAFGRILAFGMNGSAFAASAPGLGLHAASKSALISLLRTLAAEVAGSGITVNAIEPGDIREKALTRDETRTVSAANHDDACGLARSDRRIDLGLRRRSSLPRVVYLPVTGGLQGPYERKNT